MPPRIEDLYGNPTPYITTYETTATGTEYNRTIDVGPFQVKNYVITREEFEFSLNELKQKIYQIISEYTNINISEDEFMKILEE